jgi:hypothetical protein
VKIVLPLLLVLSGVGILTNLRLHGIVTNIVPVDSVIGQLLDFFAVFLI